MYRDLAEKLEIRQLSWGWQELCLEFPNLITNYANQFADGRPAKSTSIGIKDEEGQYVAALCMNIDLTLFRGMQSALEHFTKIETDSIIENLEPNGTEAIRRYIDQFASKHATTPRMLKLNERKQLIQELKNNGLLEIKRRWKRLPNI